MKFLFLFLFLPCIALSQSLETIIQQGHELAVVSIAVSPDSNYVATGSKDKSAKLWETATGREIRSFLGHSATVTSLAFSPDGKTLATGSNDKTMRYWDIATGKEIKAIELDGIVTSLAIDPQQRFVVVAGYNNSGYGDSLTVYDYASAKILARIPAAADKGLGSGVHVTLSPNGKMLAIGEDNRTTNLYSTADWSHIKKLSYEEGSCGGCGTRTLFAPDNRSFYTVSHNGPARKYSLASFEIVKTYHSNIEDLTGFALSKDGNKLAIATETKLVIWNTFTGDTVAIHTATDNNGFNNVAFRGNETIVITANDNTASEWNFIQDKTDRVYTGYLNFRDRGGLNYDPNFYWQSAIAKYIRLKNPLLLTHDGKTLIKGKFGTKVKFWDAATGQHTRELSGHKKAVLCYDLSKDGLRLVTGGGDGKIILWDLATGDSTQVIHAYGEPIFDIHFNADETQVVSCSWDATLKIHDLKSGRVVTRFDWQSVSAYNILYHPSDLYIITARLDNSLQMWEPDTRKEIRNLVGHTDIVSSLHLTADQNQLLTSSWDGTVRIWDLGTGLMAKKFRGHQGAVHASIFSTDEKEIYSAGADRQIRVWDVASGKVMKTFEGHKAEITSLALSPARNMLVSYSVDGVTKFWDLSTGKEFFEHIHLGENDWMVKNPDGYFNSTENARKHIHFVSGMETYSVDQFFNEFFRPDLLPRFFKTRSSESKSIEQSLKSTPPPGLKLAVIPGTEGKAELYVRVTNNGGGARDLKLFHNGKNIPVDLKTLILPKSRGEHTTYKHSVALIGGTNVFSATARNADNIESDLQTIELFSDHVAKNSTCHIVAVGINQYRNSKLDLNFARADAEAFSGILSAKGGELFKNVEVHTLYDQEATRENILKKLDDLSLRVEQEDVVIFYYAGHGSMIDNVFYFVPSGSSRLYDASALRRDGIEAGLLQEKFRHIKALKQLIIMDACQSGGSVELLATRGGSTEKAIAQLSRSAGIHVIASAGREQFATEFASLGHGLFTHVLLKALQGEADGSPRDGKITIYELKSYIDDQVPELTRKLKGNAQYPYTFSRGHDFPVVTESETQ